MFGRTWTCLVSVEKWAVNEQMCGRVQYVDPKISVLIRFQFIILIYNFVKKPFSSSHDTFVTLILSNEVIQRKINLVDWVLSAKQCVPCPIQFNPFTTRHAYMHQLFHCLQWNAGSERVNIQLDYIMNFGDSVSPWWAHLRTAEYSCILAVLARSGRQNLFLLLPVRQSVLYQHWTRQSVNNVSKVNTISNQTAWLIGFESVKHQGHQSVSHISQASVSQTSVNHQTSVGQVSVRHQSDIKSNQFERDSGINHTKIFFIHFIVSP